MLTTIWMTLVSYAICYAVKRVIEATVTKVQKKRYVMSLWTDVIIAVAVELVLNM